MIERGLDPALRDLVAARVIDSGEIARLLSDFPRALTNHDFHTANIGTVGDQVVIIDWAYVGWGPIGHDVGHLALSVEPAGSVDPAMAWHTLESAYCEALAAAGWSGDLNLVRRSMAVSNQLRLGWWIDTVLDSADKLTDDVLAAQSRNLTFLGGLR